MPRVEARKSFLELLPQLFLFPLLIVTVGVLVWLLFIASAQDNRSVEELIADLQSGGAHGQRQDAYTLSQKAVDLRSRGEFFPDAATRSLLAAIERIGGLDAGGGGGSDADLFEFLTLAAGSAGRPSLTVPVMVRIVRSESAPEKARMHAVRALGLSRPGDGAAGEPASAGDQAAGEEAARALLDIAGRHVEPSAWEFRWNALAGLANLRRREAVPLLEAALDDPRREVRWSAACWLATVFGNGKGASILEQLVDWDYLDGERGDRRQELTPQQKEYYMLMALEGLARLRGREAAPLLEEKARDSRSLKVRNVALRWMEELQSAKARPAGEVSGGG
jgi:hypothetical protein